MSFVVDTSVTLAWCFADEQTDTLRALLERVTETGAMAPQLWPLEALNGLLTAERRGRIDRNRRLLLAGLLRDLPIAIDDETASQVWAHTAQLAADHGLTAYDAAYLELALRRGLPLATADRALRTAAGHTGVPLLPTS